MNYLEKLIQQRLDTLYISIESVNENIISFQESLKKTNQTDLMYPNLLDNIGQAYIQKGNFIAEKIHLKKALDEIKQKEIDETQ